MRREDWLKHLRPKSIYVYLFVSSVFLYVRYRNWAYDDPFITFRYADHLYHGLGFVYNPGEPVLSTTTPLFAILLAGLGALWHDLPSLANLIGALSLALGSLFLWDLARTWKAPYIGWAALLLYPIFPLLLNTLGSETPLYIALCLGAFAFYARRHFVLSAAFAGLAVLTRPDGIVVGAVLVLDYLIRVRTAIPWAAVLTGLVVVLPWFMFASLYFGSPVPVTLAAKQHQGAMAISTGFVPGLFTIIQWYSGWSLGVELILASLGIIALSWARRWTLFLLWPVVYFLAFSLLGVSQYFWYYAPLVPGFLVLVGLGVAALSQLMGRLARAFLPALGSFNFSPAGLIILLIFSGSELQQAWQLSTTPDQRVRIYRAVGKWFDANVPPHATIGALEVGIIGYYARRPMIDFAGLIQPEVAQYLNRDTNYEDAAIWTVQRYKPNYLVLQDGLFPRLERDFSPQYCLSIQTFMGREYGYPANLQIYNCKWAP